MLERRLGVLDPGGIQLGSSGRLIGALQHLGVLHHLLQCQSTAPRTRHGVCSMGSWGSAGLGVDHVGHGVSRVGVDETDPRQRPLLHKDNTLSFKPNLQGKPRHTPPHRHTP